MAEKYRVLHQKVPLWQALFKGRPYSDWYIAQYKAWLFWREIGVFPSTIEAEQACQAHAGGDLLMGGRRIVSEFERPE